MPERHAICRLPWRACGGGSSSGEQHIRPARESPIRYGRGSEDGRHLTAFTALRGHCGSTITR